MARYFKDAGQTIAFRGAGSPIYRESVRVNNANRYRVHVNMPLPRLPLSAGWGKRSCEWFPVVDLRRLEIGCDRVVHALFLDLATGGGTGQTTRVEWVGKAYGYGRSSGPTRMLP